MPRPLGWISLIEALDYLCRRTHQTDFDRLASVSKTKYRKIFRELEQYLLAGTVEALVEIQGDYTPLTASDLHASPFKIWLNRGVPGIEIRRNEHRLAGMRIRKQHLIAALDHEHGSATPPSTRKERGSNFRDWLLDDVLTNGWRPKKEIREYAKMTFDVTRVDADEIRTELYTEHCKEGLKPGRRKKSA
jgi:hypothetical protein